MEEGGGPALRSGPARPVEDRSYLGFMAAALVLGLGAGFVLAILIPLAAATPSWGSRLPRLIQAHVWIQLQGFVGLFVAGMALRLIARLCGRRPLPAALVRTLLVLLASGAVLRLFGQVILQGQPGNLALLLAGALAAAGMLGTAASLALALARSSRRGRAGERPLGLRLPGGWSGQR